MFPSLMPAGLVLRLIAVWGLAVLAGCATAVPRPADHPAGYPLGFQEEGWASWYGPGFHGNKTASGERFDMHQMTAAHRTLPFGSIVRVRSRTTGRRVTVRINDRGPFARGRVLDLSRAAAVALGMTGPGTDRVDLEVIAYHGPSESQGAWWVQVASLADPVNAHTLMAQLKEGYREQEVRLIMVDGPGRRRYRVQVGRFTTEPHALLFVQQVERRFHVESFVVRD
jgi:rare lipoprotein A